MDPVVGGDLFVVSRYIVRKSLSNQEKIGQKLAGNHKNVDEPHQTVSHFLLSKKALILIQEGKGYLYLDVVGIQES